MASRAAGRSEDESVLRERTESRRQGERRRRNRGTRLQQASNDPLFPAKSLDDVIDNCEMIREA